MDLRAALLEEHSKAQTLKITNWIGDDVEKLAQLMHLFLHDEYRVTQRAAWAVSHVADNYPKLFAPYIGTLIHNLQKENVHVAVKRNTMRVLQDMDIPEKLWGEAADVAFDYLADVNETIAVRAFSMQICWNICKKIPELIPELEGLIDLHYEYGSKGFQSRSRKIRKEIMKFNKRAFN